MTFPWDFYYIVVFQPVAVYTLSTLDEFPFSILIAFYLFLSQTFSVFIIYYKYSSSWSLIHIWTIYSFLSRDFGIVYVSDPCVMMGRMHRLKIHWFNKNDKTVLNVLLCFQKTLLRLLIPVRVQGWFVLDVPSVVQLDWITSWLAGSDWHRSATTASIVVPLWTLFRAFLRWKLVWFRWLLVLFQNDRRTLIVFLFYL